MQKKIFIISIILITLALPLEVYPQDGGGCCTCSPTSINCSNGIPCSGTLKCKDGIPYCHTVDCPNGGEIQTGEGEAQFCFGETGEGSSVPPTEVLTPVQTCVCGDGIKVVGEQCDDGNTINGDGCSSTCKIEVCGNGILDPAERCDDGNTTNGDGCNSVCRTEICGDGTVQPGLGEQCDDRNNTNGDGCNSVCKTEVCGNGTVDSGEECDDGNTTDNDGCSSSCNKECGNNICSNGETCQTCSHDCGDCSFCGDRVIQPPETCDDGNNINEDGCSSTCQLETCGDGIFQPGLGEGCDDGNNVDGDGCNSTCQRCGNGLVEPSEECDDGNNLDGDGCNHFCVIEL